MRDAMDFVMCGRVQIVVSGAEHPSDALWTSFLDTLRNNRPKLRGILVYSGGGGPSAKQRRELMAVFGADVLPPAAVLTSSTVARGIVTALAWLKGDFIRAFKPNELDTAIDYLKVPEPQRDELRRTMLTMIERLDREAA